MDKNSHKLGLFKLIMVTLAFIMSIRNLPMLAETGWAQIFYMVVAALIFLIPTALISAELATGWPSAGGVYKWIKLAFGDRAGFIGSWMLWVQMFFGMVMIGSFIAAMLAFIFKPALANNNIYIAAVTIVIYWVATLLNLKGLKSGSLISSVGFLVGVLIPFILILGFGLTYFLGSNPIQLPKFTWAQAFPNFSSIRNLAFFVGIIFLYSGMEVSSVHANEVKNPQKNYPLAMLIAAILIMAMNIFGAFAIEIAEPRSSINLASGIMQTFKIFFTQQNVSWLIPIVAFMAAVGAFGQLSTWVLGPSTAMLQVAKNGFMPKWWQKTNSAGVPIRFVLVQATMISLVALIYVVVPAVNTGFFMVLILTTVLYAVMYLLLFASGIKLRYKYPDVKRTYRVPGGNIGMWIVGGLGFLAMLFVIFISFFPPSNLKIGSPIFYVLFMVLGLLIFVSLPIIIYARRKPEWKTIEKPIEENKGE
ncbi:MAG: amino acid permease [Candidatus Electryonea clarkiae]|nr:amino acid permease [Candidatus Electryonea clarkiae]